MSNVKSHETVIALLARGGHAAIKFLDRLLFGEDIFISYSRQDGMRIAQDLAARLGKEFAVYVDLHGSPTGADLPQPVKRRIRRATLLVLLATPGAVASQAVDTEVVDFKATGRTIIPVSFGGALEPSSLYLNELRGLAIAPERPDATSVSQETLDRIRAAFTYAKRFTRLVYVLVGASAVAGVMSGAGYYISESDRRSETEARACAERLERERVGRAVYHAMLNLPPEAPASQPNAAKCK